MIGVIFPKDSLHGARLGVEVDQVAHGHLAALWRLHFLLDVVASPSGGRLTKKNSTLSEKVSKIASNQCSNTTSNVGIKSIFPTSLSPC